MDDMTIKKGTTSKLLGADLSKSFPGALYSPSKKQQQTKPKPEPVPHPPLKPLSLLSKTDDDLQPLSWLVSPNLLHNVCGRPVQSKPPPPKRATHRTINKPVKFSSMVSHFKIRPEPYHPPKKTSTVSTMKVRAIKVNGRLIKQEPGEMFTPRSHPYKLVKRSNPSTANRTLKSKYAKPPYSFATLIFMAIEESPGKKLPVKDIYSWIIDRFPYYQLCDRGWKNSVRHNLSLNRCFKRIDKDRRLVRFCRFSSPFFS